MCGLFGILSKEKLTSQKLANADIARDSLSHRGPNQAGSYKNKNVYMGHRRLSILDTSDAGKQPMISQDEKIIITVNGEIYNFQILREELKERGYSFDSGSDSEVILHGYKAWGIDKLASLIDGMYAIVIYDKSLNKIYLIRDRVGIKPLYYYLSNDELIWASEIKAIKVYKDNQVVLNNEALLDFLVYRFIPAPKTAYKNIYKLEPASILEVNCNDLKIQIRKYWSLQAIDKIFKNEIKSARDKYLYLLDQSVEEQMVSDVPLGLLLSGGIDSSSVCAFAAKYKKNIKSFSVGFSDPQRNEVPYAKIVSELYKTEHNVHYLDDTKMDDVLEKLHDWFDEPYGDTSAIPTDYVCEVARQQVTVALSGDGGDELFGGYRWYNIFKKYRFYQRFIPFKLKYGWSLPKFIPKRKGIELLTIADPVYLYACIRGSLSASQLSEWKLKLGLSMDYDPFWAYRKFFMPELSSRKAAQVMDFHLYLPDDILTKVDICSMRHALECRPVYLSKNLIEFAFSLSEEVIYDGGHLKGFIKSSLKKYLPEVILYRKKQGFSVPNNHKWKEKTIGKHKNIAESILSYFIKN
jgi:asparagine synthase (glutamine-hydrolysing)